MTYGSLREKIAAEKVARQSRYAEYQRIFNEAHAAGVAAGTAHRPSPMFVRDATGTLIERVDDGLCGFAWVKVYPGTASFAKWAKRTGVMSSAYSGGLQYWVGGFNQSVEKKEAYARAFAEVLNRYREVIGVEAIPQSRLD